jgi:nicotinamide mononucleotide adenylyltransferase
MAANLPLQSAVTQSASTYSFPRHRLRLIQTDPTRKPLVLIACGSFSPITYLHLRIFEIAADFGKFNTEFEVIGGYLSPVSDSYKKAGLASAAHRYVSLDLILLPVSV